MKNLALIKSANFGNVQCDFWENENGDVFMTAEQLGMVLEYATPRESVNKIISRNNYLRQPEFSCEVKELCLAKYVSGWGYYVEPDTIAALGKKFTYQQARECAQPRLDAKNEELRARAEVEAAREKEKAAMIVKILKVIK